MRIRDVFTVYPRNIKTGTVYYYQCYDESGRWTNGHSTGQRTRTAAVAYCMGLYRNGDLAPHWKMPTFAEYAVGWWDTKTCHYVQMYAIWNFLKHNSLSTYQVIKDNYSDILNEGEYKQGELACYYVKLSDDLIDSIPSGVERFLKEYCKLVFSEDENEAAWNYDDYFTMQVYDAMQAEFNPLGISDFI